MKPSKAIGRLEAIYAKLPKINCQGKCTKACGPILMSSLERRRIGRVGIRADWSCELLVDGRCTRYSVRPFICRLYGVAEGLECDFGCVPERLLSREEAYKLQEEIELLSKQVL